MKRRAWFLVLAIFGLAITVHGSAIGQATPCGANGVIPIPINGIFICAGTSVPTASTSSTPTPIPTPATPVPTMTPLGNDFVAPPTATAAPYLAMSRTADFLSSIGANAHLEGSDGTYYNSTTMNKALGFLNIQHLRTGEPAAVNNISLIQSLNSSYGTKVNLIGDAPYTTSTYTTAISNLGTATDGTPIVESFEGINECDINTGGETACTSGNYVATEKSVEQTISGAILGTYPTIARLGPANTTLGAYVAVGSLDAYLDFGVNHDYSDSHPLNNYGIGSNDGSPCSGNNYGTIGSSLCESHIAAPAPKRINSTESGYGSLGDLDAIENGNDSTSSSLIPGDKADYVVRSFLEHWEYGFPRAYYYLLIDDGQSPGYSSHGLFDQIGNPKPAAVALENLMVLLNDSSTYARDFVLADPFGVRLTNPSGNAGVSNGSIDSGPYNTLLMQKANGHVLIFTWGSCDSKNSPAGTESACNATTATATFATSTPASIVTYTFNAAGDGTVSTATVTPSSSITLTYDQHVRITDLGPAASSFTFATAAPVIPTAPPNPPQIAATYPATSPTSSSGSVTLVQACQGNNGGGASFNISCPNARTVGDEIGYFGTDQGAAYQMTGGGNRYITTGNASVYNLSVGAIFATGSGWSWYNPQNTSTATTMYVSEPNGGNASAVGLEMSNVDPGIPVSVDAVLSNQTASSTAPVTCASGQTLPRAGSLVFCAIHTAQGTYSAPPPTPAPVSGWTLIGLTNTAGANNTYVYELNGTTTAGQAIPTFSSLNGISGGSNFFQYSSELVAYQPPGSGGGATFTTVTSIADLSGNGHTASSVGSVKPQTGFTLNGLNTLYYHGASLMSFATTAFGATNTLEVMGLIDNTEVSTSNEDWITLYTSGYYAETSHGGELGAQGSNSLGLYSLFSYGNGAIIASTSGTYPAVAQVINSTAQTQDVRFTGASGITNVNGDDVGNAKNATANFNAANVLFGGTYSGSALTPNYYGLMGEITMYSSPMTASQRQELAAYMVWKWTGSGASLPADNPYKSSAPTGFSPTSISGLVAWFDPSNAGSLTTP